MLPIYPINRESVKPFQGHLVLAVMQDGTEQIGVLSRLSGGRLILNEQPKETKTAAAMNAEPPVDPFFSVPSLPSAALPPTVRLSTDAIAHLFLLDW